MPKLIFTSVIRLDENSKKRKMIALSHALFYDDCYTSPLLCHIVSTLTLHPEQVVKYFVEYRNFIICKYLHYNIKMFVNMIT